MPPKLMGAKATASMSLWQGFACAGLPHFAADRAVPAIGLPGPLALLRIYAGWTLDLDAIDVEEISSVLADQTEQIP